MGVAADRILLGDIGGTNARFALFASGRLGPIDVIRVADHRQSIDAIRTFLARHADEAPVSHAVIAVAGPVEDGRCVLTNSQWVIDEAELHKAFGWAQVRVVNDFEAIAWSVPRLTASDLFAIGGGRAVPGAPAVVLGPGTGLGLACFMPRNDGGIVVPTEGGHATLPATCEREEAVIAHLRARHGHVSAERALSGSGLINLYEAIASLDGLPASERSAPEITAAALDGTTPLCRQALDMFCAMLGTFAGDAALTFGARGGAYIAGGIAPRILDYLARSQFRERFEAKGRFAPYLAAVPTWVIVHREPAFVGLQWLGTHAFARQGR
jgi:glucokinase